MLFVVVAVPARAADVQLADYGQQRTDRPAVGGVVLSDARHRGTQPLQTPPPRRRRRLPASVRAHLAKLPERRRRLGTADRRILPGESARHDPVELPFQHVQREVQRAVGIEVERADELADAPYAMIVVILGVVIPRNCGGSIAAQAQHQKREELGVALALLREEVELVLPVVHVRVHLFQLLVQQRHGRVGLLLSRCGGGGRPGRRLCPPVPSLRGRR
mmetsp:Transcript_2557/g.6388  ORF Transcript_2557/g.6388 Transcript_2557/m.6388 type:complete len:219 (-) Transcript_2557:883-1539(-)